MAEIEDKTRAAFEQFKDLYSQVQSEEGTGDPSLDILLHLVEPPFAQLIESLSIPHWFDENLVAALLDPAWAGQRDRMLQDLVNLPFVRSHRRGYVYHDVARSTLRRYLAHKNLERTRELSAQVAGDFARRRKQDGAEEIYHEWVYHTLAYDEAAGLTELDTLCTEARRSRRLTTLATLVHLAEEQRAFLSPRGNAQINYYRGLLAYDLRQWTEAEAIFGDLAVDELPPVLAQRARLYQGLTFEAEGLWQAAERVYQAYLGNRNGSEDNPEVSARFYERLAETHLSQGDELYCLAMAQ